jgi:cbb3-type cytochrome oxidase subunit 3
VGAGLSVISLCFLAFWWVHTHRRRRRERRAPGV